MKQIKQIFFGRWEPDFNEAVNYYIVDFTAHRQCEVKN